MSLIKTNEKKFLFFSKMHNNNLANTVAAVSPSFVVYFYYASNFQLKYEKMLSSYKKLMAKNLKILRNSIDNVIKSKQYKKIIMSNIVFHLLRIIARFIKITFYKNYCCDILLVKYF